VACLFINKGLFMKNFKLHDGNVPFEGGGQRVGGGETYLGLVWVQCASGAGGCWGIM
jgi:hypothetical protein